MVADALSRIAAISADPGEISYANFQRHQEQDLQLQTYLNSNRTSLRLIHKS